ncbi:MAG: hypothetical protein NT051_04160, partial [Candidatus Micrarchaeota archaeon]|nr:hypothetical protein [Candidatus Micrarchaeota archaeon]
MRRFQKRGPRSRARPPSQFGSRERANNQRNQRAKYSGRQAQEVDLHAIAHSAMQKYGFVSGFPMQVEREVNALQSRVDAREGKNVQDMRNLLWSSIDNYDTQDLDQIECCEPGANGEIHVKVGVADVDAY